MKKSGCNSNSEPFEFEELQLAFVARYSATVETLLFDWVHNIVLQDAGDYTKRKNPLPLRYDFHTGAVSTGATQDLFRCLSEQLHIARNEIPQKYSLVVSLILVEAFA